MPQGVIRLIKHLVPSALYLKWGHFWPKFMMLAGRHPNVDDCFGREFWRAGDDLLIESDFRRPASQYGGAEVAIAAIIPKLTVRTSRGFLLTLLTIQLVPSKVEAVT